MKISTVYLLIIMLVATLSVWAIASWRRLWKRRSSREMSKFLQGTSLSTFRDSLPQITKEFRRARRLDRPLSVIVILLDDLIPQGRSANPKKLNRLTQLGLLLCGTITRDALRDMDIVTHDIVNRRFIIVLPESSNNQANKLGNRLKGLIGAIIDEQVRIGIATFPTDRLVIEDLIRYAVKSAQIRSDSVDLDGVTISDSNASHSI